MDDFEQEQEEGESGQQHDGLEGWVQFLLYGVAFRVELRIS